MKIDHKSYLNYIKTLSKNLEGAQLYSPVLLNNETLFFPFESNPKEVIVISLNNKCPLLYKITNDFFFSSFENQFIKEFRKFYGKTIISNIELSEYDNIISFNLHSIETNNECKVFVELISNSPNLILTENSIIQKAYFKYKNRPSNFGENYVLPDPLESLENGIEINDDFFAKHYAQEIENRNKEKYSEFLKFINSKLKAINRKIEAIKNDVKNADEMETFNEIADSIFTLGIDLKTRLNEVSIDGKIIKLDPSKTLLENCQNFYKKSKKAKETKTRAKINLENAENERLNFMSILDEFNSRDERGKDELLLMYKPNKKHEVKKTDSNRPWKYNLNGTYIYFGRNASQNDYLSFVMKTDRDYTWLHIKDKSGAHLIIANKKPTENELLFACEFALICSHCKTGEIVYTKKKNVRKGHVLGEAILKNYSTIKLNTVREQTLKAFEDIKRCD